MTKGERVVDDEGVIERHAFPMSVTGVRDPDLQLVEE